jgi:drug/metabolite transporter (DMT)-like permease
MKPLTIVGIVLIVIGVVALAYQGISYTTTERVVDIGPLKVDAKKEKTIPLPPVLGAVAVAAGVVCLIAGARSR